MAGHDAGVLTVFAECARGLGDSYFGDIFGNQDPYLILKIGRTERRTNFARQGGKYPVWNETLSFQIGQADDEMLVTLMDKCMLVDARLGDGKFSLTRLRETRAERAEVPVRNKKGECMGVVFLAATFHNGVGPPPQMPSGPAVGAPATHALAPAPPAGMGAMYGVGMPHPGPTTAMGVPAGPPGAYPPGYPLPGDYPPASGYGTPAGYPPPGDYGALGGYPPPHQGGYSDTSGAYPPPYEGTPAQGYPGGPPPPGYPPRNPPGYPPQGF